MNLERFFGDSRRKLEATLGATFLALGIAQPVYSDGPATGITYDVPTKAKVEIYLGRKVEDRNEDGIFSPYELIGKKPSHASYSPNEEGTALIEVKGGKGQMLIGDIYNPKTGQSTERFKVKVNRHDFTYPLQFSPSELARRGHKFKIRTALERNNRVETKSRNFFIIKNKRLPLRVSFRKR